jgi:predicted nucleic acid-binding protein
MGARVIDTNVLIWLWHGRPPATRPVRSEETADAAATAWLRAHPGDAILTPVRLEFLAGTRDKEEQRLADRFLSHFKVLDGGRVLPDDWKRAEHFVRRVRGTGTARQLVDCLLLAICDRLHAELHTRERGLNPH